MDQTRPKTKLTLSSASPVSVGEASPVVFMILADSTSTVLLAASEPELGVCVVGSLGCVATVASVLISVFVARVGLTLVDLRVMYSTDESMSAFIFMINSSRMSSIALEPEGFLISYLHSWSHKSHS